MTDPTLYEVLDVAPDADAAAIKRAWRTRMRQVHPDQGGTHEEATIIGNAYAILSDPDQRHAYDELLERGGSLDDLDEWEDAEVEEEYVDAWGQEVPSTPSPTARESPVPPPQYGQQAPSPVRPEPWPWEPGYRGPVRLREPRRWHRYWLLGHGPWVVAARALTVLWTLIVVALPLEDIGVMTLGLAPWSRLGSDLFAFVLMAGFFFVGPLYRRAVGRPGFGVEYLLFLFLTAAVALVIVAGYSQEGVALGMLGVCLFLIAAAESRNFVIRTGRARVG